MANLISEWLKNGFYAKKEHDIQRPKAPTTSSSWRDIETASIQYDPFAMYTNGSVFQQAMVTMGNYNEKLLKWREMSLLPEVNEAITEIVNEAVVFEENDLPIKLNLDELELSDNIKEKIRDSFEKIVFMLDFNTVGDELFRQWYVDGCLNIEVVYDQENMSEGIKGLIKLSPFNFVKYENVQNGKITYYIHNNMSYNYVADLEGDREPAPGEIQAIFKEEQITTIGSGLMSVDKRLNLSPINYAMKAINQLYLIEDSLVVYRITRSPEKRVFYVDVGNLQKSKAEEYIQGLIRKYRQKKVYNTDLGTVENKNKQISILEDFWFPVSANGKGTKVENLTGSVANFSDFQDLDYFVNKVYKALHVPLNRKTNESNKFDLDNRVSIEKEEIKFFKYISKLRRKFNNLFVDLLKKDLIACEIFTIEDWMAIQEKIKFQYSDTNPYSEVKKLQILGMRMESANTAKGLADDEYFSKAFIQRFILNQTDEEIAQIKREIEHEKNGTPLEDIEPEEPKEEEPEEDTGEEPEEEEETSGGGKTDFTRGGGKETPSSSEPESGRATFGAPPGGPSAPSAPSGGMNASLKANTRLVTLTEEQLQRIIEETVRKVMKG